MSGDKSKLQLIGEIAQANNKNLELIEELNDREDEIEQLRLELSGYRQAILQDKEMLGLKQEIERLKTELEIAKDNEETYRLEMLDITKRLGLKEDTMFDEVKDKAEILNNIIKEVREYLDTLEKQRAYKFVEVDNHIEMRIDENEYLVWCKYNKLLNILDKGE